jgi:leader peptidase (prepilin peptidase)/N-methyltransferase
LIISFSDWAFFTSPYSFTLLAGVVGLLIGSFLNVVIYRLPILMQRQWRVECIEFLKLPQDEESGEIFNLALPASHCIHCQVPVLKRHNMPVISYLWLRGRCFHCHEKISARYPTIELLTAFTSMIVAWHFGFGEQALAGLLLTWVLIALSFIDLDHQLLPDILVLPFLWLGLLLSLFGVFADCQASIIGATCGYLILWSVYHTFKLITRKEGMGQGDFKLLAMLGAWLGWQYLSLIILLSSLAGVFIGMTLISLNKQKREAPIPFGPYLAIAGWLALLWGKELNSWYFG